MALKDGEGEKAGGGWHNGSKEFVFFQQKAAYYDPCNCLIHQVLGQRVQDNTRVQTMSVKTGGAHMLQYGAVISATLEMGASTT